MTASPNPLRLLTAVPICDGHDSAINTINLEFIRHGIEVIYLGYHRKSTDIARAAIQEDVRAIGLSSYNGGHVEFFAEVHAKLRERGGEGIGLFGGGGGTITEADAAQMSREGTDRIFFAGTPLDSMIEWVRERYTQGKPTLAPPSFCRRARRHPGPATHRLGGAIFPPCPHAATAIPLLRLPSEMPGGRASLDRGVRARPPSSTNWCCAFYEPVHQPPASPSFRTTLAWSARARCSVTGPP